jgi:hypothetical protein
MIISAVESYQVVKEQVQDDIAEQNFWTDSIGLMHVTMLRIIMRWPNSDLMVASLEQSRRAVLDYSLLRLLFPEWRNMKTMHAWLQHYSQFDFLSLSFDDGHHNKDITNQELKEHVSEELSMMLGVAPPTIFERIQQRKRLQLIGWRTRENRKVAAREAQMDLSPEGRLSEAYVRLQKKKRKLQTQIIPPAYIIHETSYVSANKVL